MLRHYRRARWKLKGLERREGEKGGMLSIACIGNEWLYKEYDVRNRSATAR